jgi:cation diffusion facilitator CzcD-associated flavoprotein CzcO
MAPNIDTDVLIIGAGMSGLGLAVQLRRHYPNTTFKLIEKCHDVGGTWLVNTYPGCGCDVASHFYSYSFALNPDWSQKFSMRSEIQAYFRGVAEQYGIVKHVRFGREVEIARWQEDEKAWEVTIKDLATKQTTTERAKIVVSAVGSLSIPQPCKIPGAETFDGKLFHSATWDSSFDWKGKDVVVLGNGCSATQFVPIMAQDAKQITQFARQAQFLAERPNPIYSGTFKAIMRYVPFAMRLYRFKLYADMEKDFAGFETESGQSIRKGLKDENEKYVKRMAPEKYWDALIPKHEIGCKRKVMDTDYLATLHRENMDLIVDDAVESITLTGVRCKSGREISADGIVLATGFEVFRMLFPMEIYGENGMSLNEHWNSKYEGAAQAYFGTCVPGFPNFFTLMGPNTVTGHLSVIYTVECQINFVLRLIAPILESTQALSRALLAPTQAVEAVDVKPEVAAAHSSWIQSKLQKLVWSSGCTSWALDPKTGVNIAMYPEYQFLFWWRSIFIPAKDFVYDVVDARQGKHNRKSISIGGWKGFQQVLSTAVVMGMMGGAAMFGVGKAGGLREVQRIMLRHLRNVVAQGKLLLTAR